MVYIPVQNYRTCVSRVLYSFLEVCESDIYVYYEAIVLHRQVPYTPYVESFLLVGTCHKELCARFSDLLHPVIDNFYQINSVWVIPYQMSSSGAV